MFISVRGEDAEGTSGSLLHSDDALKLDGSAASGGFVVPDAQLLFSGHFERAGLDLVLSHDDHSFVVHDYFRGEGRAALFAPDGASLSGAIVDSLAGHVEVAQLGGAAGAANVIGTVVKLTGSASAIRNGVEVALNIGDKVHKGDVVQSGGDSALGISFIDGTAFSLGSNARMALNDMVYDANGSSNSSLLSLVQGTISFVAGETAKHGNMKIDTPVATMGIRGTAVVVDMTADNGPVKFSVLVEPGGVNGSYVLLDKATGETIATVAQPGIVTFVSPGGINRPPTVVELPKTPLDLQGERDIVKLVFSIAFPQFNFDDANPKIKFAMGSSVNNLADARNSGIGNDGIFDFYVQLASLKFGAPTDPKASFELPPTFIHAPPAFSLVLKSSDVVTDLPGFLEGVGPNVEHIGTFTVISVAEDSADPNHIIVNWAFTIDENDPVLLSLAQGQRLTQTYTVSITNSLGKIVSQDIQVTLVGTNQAPEIVSSVGQTAVTEGIAVNGAGNLSASGAITFRDVDLIDTHTATVTLKSSISSAHLPGYVDNVSQIGTLSVSVAENNTDTNNLGAVNWSFTVANNDPVLQSLAKGQTLTQVYTVTITDNNGAKVTQDITVTLVGTNEAPVIVSSTNDTPIRIEDSVPADQNLSATGTITFRDVDLIDTHTATIALKSSTSSAHLPGYVDNLSQIGTLSVAVAENSADTNNLGAVNWSFTVPDSDPVLQSLAKGQTLTQVYTVTITDNNGAQVTQDITVTLVGTNDAPTIVSSSDDTPIRYEDQVPAYQDLSATGIITFRDLDLIDTHTATVALKSSTASAHLPGYVDNINPIGSFALTSGPTGVSENTTDTNNTGTVGWSFTVPDCDPVLQSLAKGQTLTQVYTVTITDNNGAQVTQDVTVTLVGTNDAPTIVSSTDDTPIRYEDQVPAYQNLSATGTITFRDLDLIDTHTATVALKSSTSGAHLPGYVDNINPIGSFALTSGPTGVSENTTDTDNTGTVAWCFTVANNDPVLQSLAKGQTLTQVYTVTITDNNGAQVTQDVTVMLVGTNDAPTIVSSSDDTPIRYEDQVPADQNLSATGTITFRDVDLIDTHTATVALKCATSSAGLPGYDGPIGSFALTSGPTGVSENTADTDNTGTVGWCFTVADSDPVLQSLAKGQTLTQVYTITITDNNGAQVTQDVTVTLVGTNDAPTIVCSTDDTPSLVEDSVPANQSLSAEGTITFRDLDLIDTHTATFTLKSSTSSAHLPGYVDNVSEIGCFTLTSGPTGVSESTTDTDNTGTVGWCFTVPDCDPVLQSLAKGQTLTQVYTVTITDNNGAQVTQDVTVTLVGSNDAPTIVCSTDDTPIRYEDQVPANQNLSATGTITFQDVDLIDTHTATVALKCSTSSAHLPGYVDNISQIGTLSVSVAENSADASDLGAVNWTFKVPDSDPVLQSLAEGQTLTQVYTVTITDNNGAQVTQDVTVTLVGSNDAPTIVSSINDAPSLVEDSVPANQLLSAEGTITFRDLDLIDAHTATFTLKSSTSSAHLPGYVDNVSEIGCFALTSGPTGVSENTIDTDNTGTVGWCFTVPDCDPVLQSLAKGQTLTQVYTVTITDCYGAQATQDVTVTLVGTNDVPIITSEDLQGRVFEAVSPSAILTDCGTITFDDRDLIDVHLISSTGTPVGSTLGHLTVVENHDTTGTGTGGELTWTYTVDNSLVKYLKAGETKVESFIITLDDQNGGVITRQIDVTIVGTGEPPIANNDTNWAKEDTNLTASGNVLGTMAHAGAPSGSFSDVADTDPDGDPLTVSALAGSTFDGANFTATGQYGRIAINQATGAYKYTLANDRSNVQALAKGQVVEDSFTYTISDGQGGYAQATVTISVFGTNDAPVIASSGTTHDTAKNLSAANGQVISDGHFFFGDSDLPVTDVDNNATYGIAVLAADNAHGSWEYKIAGGNWTKMPTEGVLLLSASDRVRFTGSGNESTEQLTFKAWDGTDERADGSVIPTLTSLGGSSAYSVGTYVVGAKNDAPAGVAGEPINLGLANASIPVGSTVTITIKDVPVGWTINGGVQNQDGSWTLQTTDPSSLSVATPQSFFGAVVLNVVEAVTALDGMNSTFIVQDNVEAYAANTPIFAWSGDDFLTGSGGNDLFVFSQPIGHDTVYSFDAAHDRIDLIGYAGFASFDDVRAHLSGDAGGNAVITLGSGQSILLHGVDAAALSQDNFVFDQAPAFANGGTMSIADGAFIPLSGTVNNSGTIALQSTADETELQLIEHGLTLTGGGKLVLSDSDFNVIAGTSAGVSLDNHDNTIVGAGQLGRGALSLTNAGTINANGVHALAIDTGSNTVVNSGVLEASGSGGLTIADAVANSGSLWANGASLAVQGAVSGNGSAIIDGTGVVDFEAASTANVVFGAGTGGRLKLADAFHFTGTISGFDGADTIDLTAIDFNRASISYHSNALGTGGTLTISDGTNVAELSFVGKYAVDNFSFAPDPVKGLTIAYAMHDLVA